MVQGEGTGAFVREAGAGRGVSICNAQRLCACATQGVGMAVFGSAYWGTESREGIVAFENVDWG